MKGCNRRIYLHKSLPASFKMAGTLPSTPHSPIWGYPSPILAAYHHSIKSATKQCQTFNQQNTTDKFHISSMCSQLTPPTLIPEQHTERVYIPPVFVSITTICLPLLSKLPDKLGHPLWYTKTDIYIVLSAAALFVVQLSS